MAAAREPADLTAKLVPEMYAELRRLAERSLAGERAGHTLQPTALVHEVYLKLARQSRLAVQDRAHFLALAAVAMRQVLVDHARAHAALKRGGGWKRVTLAENVAVSPGGTEDVLVLDGALTALAEYDPRASRVVELRFFGGLTEVEVAAEMGMSERWVRGQWTFARAWLQRRMAAGQ